MPALCRHWFLAAFASVAICLIPLKAFAATNYFIPVADTSLLEVSPTNNLGGYHGMNAGTTQNGPRTRALLRFDFTTFPTNTLVQSHTWLCAFNTELFGSRPIRAVPISWMPMAGT